VEGIETGVDRQGYDYSRGCENVGEKDMTTTELMKRKNKIVFDVTYEILVPLDQIVEVNAVRLKPRCHLYASNCIYCELFKNDYCRDCPMAIAGNMCLDNVNSTYKICNELWNEKATQDDKDKLYNLIVEYDTELISGDKI